LGEKESILECGLTGAVKGVNDGQQLTKVGILFEKLEQKKIDELRVRFSGAK
jgi:hypothetical protein